MKIAGDEVHSPGNIHQQYAARELEQAKRLRCSFDRLPAVDYEFNRDRYYRNELKGK